MKSEFRPENFFYHVKGPTGIQRQTLPIVFLHGVMGFGLNWSRIVHGLQADFFCLYFDQRGHGRSFKPKEGYGSQDYAQDVWNLTEHLGWKKIHLVGHSMGGRNALSFAHHFPEKLETLVIEDIGPRYRVESSHLNEKILRLVPVPFASRQEAKDYFAGDFGRDFPEVENRGLLADFLYTNLVETEVGGLQWRFSKEGILETLSLGRQENFIEILERLAVPTLFIRGERSEDFTAQDLADVKALNDRIETCTIPNAGHWVHTEQPQIFIDVLKDFYRVGK